MENMLEKYNIEQICLLPMGQDENIGFSSEEEVRDFFDNDLSENGIYYYGKRGLDIYNQDTLILFQYNGFIIGYGVLKTRNYEKGYYQFYPESIHNIEKISSVEFKAVNPDFKKFGQGMASVCIEFLEPISVLLKIKQAVFDERGNNF